MQPAEVIAQILGPMCAVVGIGLLVNADVYRRVVKGFGDSPALCYLAGVFALVLSLLILAFHHAWAADWTVVVTIIGWLGAIKGSLLIVYPKILLDLSERLLSPVSRSRLWGAGPLVLGLFLIAMGYRLT